MIKLKSFIRVSDFTDELPTTLIKCSAKNYQSNKELNEERNNL